MKKPNDNDRLNHILDSIEKIETYLLGFNLEMFNLNEEKIDAVVRNIEIIGEATNCLDRGLKAKYPQVEWRFATAIRNRLIHGYFDIDPEIIWSVTQNDLPRLKIEIGKILEELK
jgi:uncharacterized protein with HEPN domain